MVAVTRVHTADLTPDCRLAIRSLLDDAFAGEFAEEDWQNTLGGLHVIVQDDAELVGHVAVVQRRLLHRDASISTGYIEGLAVRRDRRRRGYANTAMAAAEQIVRAAYDLGALSDGTNIAGFYERRGWLRWPGPTAVLTPAGIRRTPDEDGTVLVLPTPTSPRLDPTQSITCDWRPGDVW